MHSKELLTLTRLYQVWSDGESDRKSLIDLQGCPSPGTELNWRSPAPMGAAAGWEDAAEGASDPVPDSGGKGALAGAASL